MRMQLFIVVLLLTFGITFGCSHESSQSTPQPSTSPTASVDAPPRQGSEAKRHVYLSSTDLAKELREHCGAASTALDRAESRLSASLRPDLQKLEGDLTDARKNMSNCMTLVHGVEENAIGNAAENDTKTK